MGFSAKSVIVLKDKVILIPATLSLPPGYIKATTSAISVLTKEISVQCGHEKHCPYDSNIFYFFKYRPPGLNKI